MKEIITGEELQEKQKQIYNQIKKTNYLLNLQVFIGIIALFSVIAYFLLLFFKVDSSYGLKGLYIGEIIFFTSIFSIDLYRYDVPLLREINSNFKEIEITIETKGIADNDIVKLFIGLSSYVSSLYHFLCYLVGKRKKGIHREVKKTELYKLIKRKLVLNVVIGILLVLSLSIFIVYIEFYIWFYISLAAVLLLWIVLSVVWFIISNNLKHWIEVYYDFEIWGARIEKNVTLES